MTDDLGEIARFGRAMAVVKMKAIRLQKLNHFDLTMYLPVMISCYRHHVTPNRHVPEELGRFPRRGLIVNQIAEDDETPRCVLLHEGH